MVEYEKIKKNKRWDEYTEEEREALPPLPEFAESVSDSDYTPFVWNVKKWVYIWRD